MPRSSGSASFSSTASLLRRSCAIAAAAARSAADLLASEERRAAMLAWTARVGRRAANAIRMAASDVAGRLELGQAQRVQPLRADEQHAVHGEDDQRGRNPHPGRTAHRDQDEQPDRAQDGQVNASRRGVRRARTATTATAATAIAMAAAVSPADRPPPRIRGSSQAAAPRTASQTAIATAG